MLHLRADEHVKFPLEVFELDPRDNKHLSGID